MKIKQSEKLDNLTFRKEIPNLSKFADFSWTIDNCGDTDDDIILRSGDIVEIINGAFEVFERAKAKSLPVYGIVAQGWGEFLLMVGTEKAIAAKINALEDSPDYEGEEDD